jgi:type IV pilus assembly protein PilA
MTKRRRETMKRIQRGFTLIELMIVVAIIGILAAIAIPQYQDYVARSQVSEATTLMDGLKTPIGECANTLGTLTGCDDGTNGIPAGASIKGNYTGNTTAPTVAAGVMTFTMDAVGGTPPVSARATGGVLTMTPTLNAGSIVWGCTNAGFPGGNAVVPSVCR